MSINETKSNKKKQLAGCVLILALAGVIFCVYWLNARFNAKSEGGTSVSVASDKQYQYSRVNLDDLQVNTGKNKVPLSEYEGTYTLTSSCYDGEELSLYLGSDLYTVDLKGYVEAESLKWLYNGSELLTRKMSEGVVREPNLFTCEITYVDGEVGEGIADYAEVYWIGDVAHVSIYIGSSVFEVEFNADPSTIPVAEVTEQNPETESPEGEVEGTEDGEVDESQEADDTDLDGSDVEDNSLSDEPIEDVESSSEAE